MFLLIDRLIDSGLTAAYFRQPLSRPNAAVVSRILPADLILIPSPPPPWPASCTNKAVAQVVTPSTR